MTTGETDALSVLQTRYAPDPVPSVVARLLAAERKHDRIHDDFEVWVPSYDRADPTAAWFRGETKPQDRMITIGTGEDGALYILWCYGGRSPDRAPVAYLGSEGSATLLATDLEAFWEMLLGGESLGPYDGIFYPPEAEEIDPEDAAGAEQFRTVERGDKAPRPAAAIREEALAQHPDFTAYVDKLV